MNPFESSRHCRTMSSIEAANAASAALPAAETACGVAPGELLLMEPPDRYSHGDGTVPGDAKVRWPSDSVCSPPLPAPSMHPPMNDHACSHMSVKQAHASYDLKGHCSVSNERWAEQYHLIDIQVKAPRLSCRPVDGIHSRPHGVFSHPTVLRRYVH